MKEQFQTIHFELRHLSYYATVTTTNYLIYTSAKMLEFEEDATYKLPLELDLLPHTIQKAPAHPTEQVLSYITQI